MYPLVVQRILLFGCYQSHVFYVRAWKKYEQTSEPMSPEEPVTKIFILFLPRLNEYFNFSLENSIYLK